MLHIKKLLTGTALFLLPAGAMFAQDGSTNPIDTLANAVSKLQQDVDALKKLKITGYVQAQFQLADSAGISSFEGGNFAPLQDKRFLIRRGRVKFNYMNPLTQAVVQIDATTTGVSVIEAYAVGTEPWLRAFSLSAGIMNRPFGFEIPYSSSLRESPERGRMSQIIMNGERDLGAMVTFQMPKESRLNWFKIQGGMFNGTGRTANDFDTQKDFIGQIVIARTNKAENFKYSGGVSYYNGGVREFSKKVDMMGTETNGDPGFVVDSAITNIGHYAKRQYMGGDIQLSLDWPAGVTTVRAEYIQGKQPATATSSASFTAAPASTADIYSREFNGAYFYFAQNILQSKHQILVKYDWYDPNTKVSGDQIKGGATKLGAADIKYNTLGVGYIFHWDHNIKITAYYAMVKNETSKNLSGYTKDLKDNVFTLRMQYKF